MTEKRILPVHPGETLSEEFLEPMGITEYQLAVAANISEIHIHEIVRGKRPVTAETALRFGKYFGMSPRFWIGLQGHYDLAVAEDKLQERLEREIQPYCAIAA
ncbi:MAG: addiction module antidote protein, HigA family [Deltaproteobacteria bacterium]|nr:MAG: addiction module antidote protein, HigA family [Deltaproteobacteria bacterium]